MEKKIVKVLWGDDHYEDTLEETIHYMIEHEELYKDEIVGKQVEFCEEANVYGDVPKETPCTWLFRAGRNWKNKTNN